MDQDMDEREETALAEIQHVMQGVRWSLKATYAFGRGVGVQVMEDRRKVGPLLFPADGQSLEDLLGMLGSMAAKEHS